MERLFFHKCRAVTRCTSRIYFFVLLLLLLPGFSSAQPPDASSSSGNRIASSHTTKDELLLFWDEKDLYVQSATRHEKPISQAAENITVITAKEIEEMNAHTVAEVLNRISGVFVDFSGHDFGSSSLLHIQGSEERHVLVMLDGIAWNAMNSGSAETITIPVRIIDRIEVIKGPASSAWGSSLGGVVNIITKNTGDARNPSGTLSASYGEARSQDESAEVSGKAGPVGYYLFAGRQESKGLRDDRDFRSYSLFSKVKIPLSKDVALGVAAGYSEPKGTLAVLPSYDLLNRGLFRAFFGTASLDAAISPELKLNVQFNTFKQKFNLNNSVLGMGLMGAAGDLYQDSVYDEKTTGVSGRLVWTRGAHTAVFGAEYSHGTLEQVLTAGPLLQSIGVPETMRTDPSINKWAVYANDTITFGRFTITPGIRHDHNNITGSFTSPSLGATYKLAEKTILRASVARGFTIPPLAFTSGGGLFLDPNPSLRPEKVWSYQGGVESGVCDYLWLKAAVFYHDMRDAIVPVAFGGGPPAYNDIFINEGKIRRQGVEVEAETVPVYNLSLKAGFAYVQKKPSLAPDTVVNYAYNIGIKYDDRKSFMAQLFGHYVWWGMSDVLQAKYDAFIWDLNIRKRIYSTEKTETELFLTGHNIFSGSQYTIGDVKNPGRWVEAGLRFKF